MKERYNFVREGGRKSFVIDPNIVGASQGSLAEKLRLSKPVEQQPNTGRYYFVSGKLKWIGNEGNGLYKAE